MRIVYRVNTVTLGAVCRSLSKVEGSGIVCKDIQGILSPFFLFISFLLLLFLTCNGTRMSPSSPGTPIARETFQQQNSRYTRVDIYLFRIRIRIDAKAYIFIHPYWTRLGNFLYEGLPARSTQKRRRRKGNAKRVRMEWRFVAGMATYGFSSIAFLYRAKATWVISARQEQDLFYIVHMNACARCRYFLTSSIFSSFVRITSLPQTSHSFVHSLLSPCVYFTYLRPRF